MKKFQQSSSQLLTVNLVQLTPEKQCLTSPNSDDSVATAETFPKEKNTEVSEELRMQMQG